MSIHALIAVAYLEDLDPATKLVLMAVADSADEDTLEAAPGLPKLRAWSGLGKSRTLEIVANLSTAGYLDRVSAGRVGRRAVYRVCPSGLPPIPHPDEVRARYEPVDNHQGGGSGPPDPHVDLSVRSTPQEGPAHRTPSVPPFITRAPTPRSARRPPVDKRPAPRIGPARCPIHPEHLLDCPRCLADVAAPAEAAKAAAYVRAMLTNQHAPETGTHP